MTRLSEVVHVARRFQRSIKIDSDLRSPEALKGFVCPESSATVLTTMATHKLEGKQTAFTWTGPYGSGKSSLVIALSALTCGNKERREEAAAAVGKTAAAAISQAFPIIGKGWEILPVVARRAPVAPTVGETIIRSGMVDSPPREGWDEQSVLAVLEKVASARNVSGLIVFIDEMGKFLEAAAGDGADLYLFQLLAEAATRSNGKLVIVGILHQAFEEYSNRLARHARDEWSKIQGRFVDLSVNTAGEEQIDLLARAIQTNRTSPPSQETKVVANCIRANIVGVSGSIEKTLEATWPLHPLVASLLGPISRRRFGQNQRSLFSFLNSAEPFGFQEFIQTSTINDFYTPDKLWDYLRANLEPAIMASPDGHRWAAAIEALSRCEANNSPFIHITLLKSIAVIDLFRDRSGLYATQEVLETITRADGQDLDEILNELRKSSLIIYRRHLNAYSIYEGSDFDIEGAMEHALQETHEINFAKLHSLASIHPVLAKKHYFETGSLRWFDVKLGSAAAVTSTASLFSPQSDVIGQFLLALPTLGETKEETEALCKEASRKAHKLGKPVITGYPERAWTIISLARELSALERIRLERPELTGDSVARREVNSRIILLQNELESELQQALMSSTWFRSGNKLANLTLRQFNNIVSEVANEIYPDSPRIHNELLNRNKPSSNAVAAQNNLLKAMINNEGEYRLGIEGYPAEGGLFDSILKNTSLYRYEDGGDKFCSPICYNACNLVPAWKAADALIEQNPDRLVPMTEIFDCWEAPPIGMKRGLMPILGTAYILSTKTKLAIYREGLFQPNFSDIDTDYLARDPGSIQLRHVNLNSVSQDLVADLGGVIANLLSLSQKEPTVIEVARGIVAIFDRLPNWTKRTQKVSDASKAMRNMLKNAHDPNELIFSDLPNLWGLTNLNNPETSKKVVTLTSEALYELRDFYNKQLTDLENLMLHELGFPYKDEQSLARLRERADNIKQISGHFRVDAFTSRLVNYEGKISQFEGIGSLAANKPPRDWVDTDLDRARIEIVAFCELFKRTEAYSRVKLQDKDGSAISVIVSGKRHVPHYADINFTEEDHGKISSLADEIAIAITKRGITDNSLALAALAKISVDYIEKINSSVIQKEDSNEPA